MRHIYWSIAIIIAFVTTTYAQVQAPSATQATATTKPHDFEKWEKAISQYEAADTKNPPAKGGTVFIGSSTIGRWKTLKEDFAGVEVINRGFGGSEIIDAAHFADRIVIPYEPKAVFLRSGGNDIHAGKTAEQVFDHFKQFVDILHAKLPDTKIYFIGLCPAPSRAKDGPENFKLNDLVKEYVKDAKSVEYIDAANISLDQDGKIREDLFVQDRLHFNPEGYKLLVEKVKPYVK